ncbi:hypothetical protein SODALDRAFT_138204 [Sodiomyces alkalinus F11]|uniref:NTF2-like protein n=1 Tax=Sodiomyces alkalinus (strain CBS 110278 / VKM F-3762 / F11) TaxID=1314773 RepID=A0A3N2PZ46_SODAK|nr:hypothetical protein SODALDRAFT_138204 [Sodiomyces alkalinus F11]ROT39803.1 hypothetical protein SODALDRAFT_138204 [Sodiomyces alkalinus F11]
MTATATYQQFLAAPNSSLLAADASLHYITTTTSFHGPNNIIKHLSTQRNNVKKEKEELLHVIEGPTAIAAEVDTSLGFVISGGTYLPGLDDNFVADRTASLLIMHIVTFDTEGKITQIRQSWDQGSLLKQLDVIGKSARNWPIRDSVDQLKLVTNSLKSTGVIPTAPETTDTLSRARGNSQNALRDPHASLSLFESREKQATDEIPAVVSPYAGTRPQQRSLAEIFGDEPAEEVGSPSAGRERHSIATKTGAGKNFQPSRLFNTDEDTPEEPDTPETVKSPAKASYRPHPQKYEHFHFADGSDPQDAAAAAATASNHRPRSPKNNANWSFDDFVTPQKAKPSKTIRHQDIRHWDTENNEAAPADPAAQKPRRDAEPHFEFVDDGLPSGQPRLVGRPKGTAHNAGLHLYDNNLYNEDGSAPTPSANRPLGNITNLSDRRKDFDAHFAMTDNSPTTINHTPQPNISDDRQKAVTMMNANWSSYDKSPASHKENKPEAGNEDRGVHISGDSMGGMKGSNRAWMFGGDEDSPKPAAQKSTTAQKDFWDF